MGISLSWVAVQALPPESILARLSLTPTGKTCTLPFKGVASHPLPNNWFLIAASRCDHRIANTKSMSALSSGCMAVACAIEEHVNFASIELWQDGQRLWHVEHQGDEDPENMSFDGQLPQRFRDLMTTVETQDSENLEGHFHMDIPLILAKELTGFRHDEINPEVDDTPFDQLTDLRASKTWRTFWR